MHALRLCITFAASQPGTGQERAQMLADRQKAVLSALADAEQESATVADFLPTAGGKHETH